ncbi:hypothetical protein E2C01_013124 [Portunus trituberculatus]|uniref:Uncharacterized protein n=1 Tax=Portunus trituberculatus TaxID=210409 RepID=A0A5B7DG39_PORTR|nr:hypothetical protein [Portunus trituberculatus]
MRAQAMPRPRHLVQVNTAKGVLDEVTVTCRHRCGRGVTEAPAILREEPKQSDAHLSVNRRSSGTGGAVVGQQVTPGGLAGQGGAQDLIRHLEAYICRSSVELSLRDQAPVPQRLARFSGDWRSFP